MDFDVFPLNDHAVIIELGNEINLEVHKKVKTVTTLLDNDPFDWMVEYVPSFTTVTVYYDPVKVYQDTNRLPYELVCQQINNVMKDQTTVTFEEQRVIDIPVCYGGELGPDLDDVAKYNQLTKQEVIDIHTGGEYVVYAIGFAPGFPYIGGMSAEIATPRRQSPRVTIPAGSVGIAGEQTGVYPVDTPGGWQLIGNTPMKLFQPNQQPPSLLQAGDQIKFYAITKDEYERWGKEE
ncbi:5-oxoprolinase subunit PxpB [Aquibacillus sediminis]|uniref:5-oxoprolinase subunit PxpB n=1 Tax=Aquibacillus sediminis TaxID=2574734 RepID=UPI001109ABCA|nr:5-oxoprolinase subunit PxpB [Aquibacillus sediminis]